MRHSIGDTFTVYGIECQVKYINLGKAWLFPTEDHDLLGGHYLMTHCAIATISKKGIIRLLSKVLSSAPSQSGAV